MKVYKKPFFLITCLALCAGFITISTSACAKRKNKNNTNISMQKPMRPDGKFYAAYDSDNNWVLEMELDGSFVFIDFEKRITFKTETTAFSGFQEENRQGIKWIMSNEREQQLSIKIFEDNCHSHSPFNKSFELEIKTNQSTNYRLTGCGSYHQGFGFEELYELSTINGANYNEYVKLTDAPTLRFNKINANKLIEGQFGCRFWRSELNILERSFVFNYDLAPNMNCHENEMLSVFMEKIGYRVLHFSFSANNNTLTLSDKIDTFVFIKKN
jgi:hypothetical protein